MATSRNYPSWYLGGDLYSVLGVNEIATPEEIHTAYRKLTELRPDILFRDLQVVDPQMQEAFSTRFNEIDFAYQILSDPNERALYNAFGADELIERLTTRADEAQERWDNLQLAEKKMSVITPALNDYIHYRELANEAERKAKALPQGEIKTALEEQAREARDKSDEAKGIADKLSEHFAERTKRDREDAERKLREEEEAREKEAREQQEREAQEAKEREQREQQTREEQEARERDPEYILRQMRDAKRTQREEHVQETDDVSAFNRTTREIRNVNQEREITRVRDERARRKAEQDRLIREQRQRKREGSGGENVG